jgi:LEA14-like dessication related protein
MKIKSLLKRTAALVITLLIFTGCGRYNDINVKGIKDIKFRGLKQNVVLLSFEIEIDNPNTRKITVIEIDFKAWLNNRELGSFRVTEPIMLVPCSRQTYSVPAEIELRTIADAFRIASSGSIDKLLDKLEVEGKIKGKSFPIRKTIRIERQSLNEISSTL